MFEKSLNDYIDKKKRTIRCAYCKNTASIDNEVAMKEWKTTPKLGVPICPSCLNSGC